ncbi:DUF397 domain-containing protein [Streptomyces hirsutus]|uniref:DUF397 domain-containing protein n=1 Tax=Streptomyces hirsutus TaxID=35620 RepID=A0ABZ1GMC6_9ACTN|nr:DUF397 domain-containing protein [Streptomyces hirsutus]WSD07333.1 DUF397 domain-containing protein [Streptomyces hirsutus]WTD19247.1 DUF397 domain-containing protein [Streptomyces hirsutus]WTD75824.1 DUF397 domain-containing protein [Streptomyces sp. NBC_01635]
MIRKASARDASEPAWFKSSYSSGTDGNSCVELAVTPGTVHVRDSKNAEGPRLAFAPDTWTSFVPYVSEG